MKKSKARKSPKERMGMYSFYIDEQRRELLKKESDDTGQTQANILRRAIDIYFDIDGRES